MFLLPDAGENFTLGNVHEVLRENNPNTPNDFSIFLVSRLVDLN